MVVVTQTLSTWGGSFYVSPGLGFLYNNHLRMARARRGAPGALTPHARSSSANASTILCREVDGRLVPRLALGAAGSAWIVPSVVEVIEALVDGGLVRRPPSKRRGCGSTRPATCRSRIASRAGSSPS